MIILLIESRPVEPRFDNGVRTPSEICVVSCCEQEATTDEIEDVFARFVEHLSCDSSRAITHAIVKGHSRTCDLLELPWPDPALCVLDVWFLPAQTDNAAKTIKFLLSRCALTSGVLGLKSDVRTVRRYQFQETPSLEEFENLKLKLRINDLLHMCRMHDLNGEIVFSNIVEVKTETIPPAPSYDFSKVSRQEFYEINRDLGLGLKSQDLDVIRNYYLQMDRPMSRLELETYAQSWSEHCKHRIFSASIDDIESGLYKHYIKRATEEIRRSKGEDDFCASVFSDNSGAIIFDDEYLVTAKVETHNSPSALDPFGGAITGILGVNRDCVGFGLGAKPIANTYAFCFSPKSKSGEEKKFYRDAEKHLPLIEPEYIAQGVIEGIEAGGNQSGIPTVHGKILFDRSYIAKPLVFAGTIGLIKREIHGENSVNRKPNDGDLVLILGGRTGQDGIHGAIISSEELNKSHNYTHVQIGDPITQKKMTDMILEMRDAGLINAMTDNGAGGFSSSIGELGSSGFDIDLDRVLLKAARIAPHEIWISESQERMTLAVSKDSLERIAVLAKKHDVEFQVLGAFNSSGLGKIRFSENDTKRVVEIDLDLLHNGAPKLRLTTEEPVGLLLTAGELESVLQEGISAKLLGKIDDTFLVDPNIVTTKENDSTLHEFSTKIAELVFETAFPRIEVSCARRFDHTVQGQTLVGPAFFRGNSDPSLTKDALDVLLDTSVIVPRPEKTTALAITSAMLPEYGKHMASNAIDTAVRNLIVAGANPEKIALLDNFCWSDSNNKESLWLLKQVAEECYEFATAFGAPFISGKDSMFNDFKGFDEVGQAVHLKSRPTLLITAVGIIDDTEHCTTPYPQKAPPPSGNSDLLMVIGDTLPDMGGSSYYDVIGFNGGIIPTVNKECAIANYKLYRALLMKGLVKRAISVHKGGLMTALMRINSMSPDRGRFVLRKGDIPVQDGCTLLPQILFSESPSRIMFTISQGSLGKVMNLADKFDATCAHIGDGDTNFA